MPKYGKPFLQFGAIFKMAAVGLDIYEVYDQASHIGQVGMKAA